MLSASWGHSPTHFTTNNTTSPIHVIKRKTSTPTHVPKGNTNERNIDDWVTVSYPGGSQSPLNRSQDSDPDLGNGQFVREVGIRRRSSVDGVRRRKTSLSPPPRWVWLICLSISIVYITGRRSYHVHLHHGHNLAREYFLLLLQCCYLCMKTAHQLVLILHQFREHHK